MTKRFLLLITGFLFQLFVFGQLVINEGSNRNYLVLPDENLDYPDWIELYNSSSDTISLLNYALTDDIQFPEKWTFPSIKMVPGEFKPIFCSGKDRKPISGFQNVLTATDYTPTTGWNTHNFSTPFYWDGFSNVLINICAYDGAGYTENSIFNQTSTPFASTLFSFQDNSDASCSHTNGTPVNQRPNLQLNGQTIGTGTIQNSPTDYPAPYGNWYWGSRHQILILASELSDAGIVAGYINSLAFDVASTNPSMNYDIIYFDLVLTSMNALTTAYESVNPNNYQHTNFSISNSGEFVYLYQPSGTLSSSLYVDCQAIDISRGRFPDATSNAVLFGIPTPGASNNTSSTYSNFLSEPILSLPSGLYDSLLTITIDNPNGAVAQIRYTLDGSEPNSTSPIYNESPITVFTNTVIKARCFSNELLPSESACASYLLGVNHTTPIISIVTDNSNLYGPNGIFDNWSEDWERAAYVDYFNEERELRFSQNSGMQVDGGWGGSRYHPQHSFRLELDNNILGDGPINDSIIPFRQERTLYSRFYLRNGSNQYLVFPYKDAYQTQAMAGTTHNYHSAWRPTTVYINGGYFGLYELREKFDAEYFQVHDGADPDSTDILSLSAWNNFILRSVHGAPADTFYINYNNFNLLNPANSNYWDQADQYFDMEWYNDYIIGESWMGNYDWPGNNIKIVRSNKTGFRYRFCTIDLELCLNPNGWSSAYDDHIANILGQSPDNPFINIWLKGIQNNRFRDYFINRFADLMNTEYHINRLLPLEQYFFDQTVIEMQKEYARWGDPNAIPSQMMNFYNNHLTFRNELSVRSSQVRQHIRSNFDLPNQVNLTLNVHPEGAGKIHISTIEPSEYPWQGIYFNGVPIKIEAKANPGYIFANWGNNPLIENILNAVYLDTLDTYNTSLDAYFDIYDLGLEENISLPVYFSLYPNPASNSVTIINKMVNLNAELSYEILDLTGRVLLNGKLNDNGYETPIDLLNLPRSVFVIRFKNQVERLGELKFVRL